MSLHIMTAFSKIIFYLFRMHQSIAMASTMQEVLKIHNDKSDTIHEKITAQNGFNTDFAKSNFIMIWIIFQPGWGNKTLSFR